MPINVHVATVAVILVNLQSAVGELVSPLVAGQDGAFVHVPFLNVRATVGFAVGVPVPLVMVTRPPESVAATAETDGVVPHPADRTKSPATRAVP